MNPSEESPKPFEKEMLSLAAQLGGSIEATRTDRSTYLLSFPL